MTDKEQTPLHMIDLIRRKRDGGALDGRELGFIARGAADAIYSPATMARQLAALPASL